MTRTLKQNWYLEVVHEPTGNILTPEIVGTPQRNPKIQGMPEVIVDVPRSQKWNDTVFEGATARLWFNGKRQNIEEIERVEQNTSTTTLILRGGVELRNLVAAEYSSERSDTVATEIINNNTTYTADVDSQPNDTFQNQLITEVDNLPEWEGVTSTGITDDQPVQIVNTELRIVQSTFVEDEDIDGSPDPDVGSAPAEFSNGQGRENFGSVTFTPEYDIPSENVGIAWRAAGEDNDADNNAELDGLDVTLDGTTVASFVSVVVPDTLGWRETGTTPGSYDSAGGFDLDAGTSYTLEVDYGPPANGEDVWIDVVAVYDDRFQKDVSNWDNDNGGAFGGLEDPQLIPQEETITLDVFNTPLSVSGLRFEGNYTGLGLGTPDVSGAQEIELSNDGTNYKSATNTETFETDFDTGYAGPAIGPDAFVRLTLDSTDDTRTQPTPTQGYEGQRIEDFRLEADLNTTSFVNDTVFDDNVDSVLSQIASTGDFVWSFNIDDDGTKNITFTGDSQRESTSNADIQNFSVKKDTAKKIEKCIVYGTTRSTGEYADFASNTDTIILDEDYLKEGSESIRAVDTSQQTFVRGVDYEMDYTNGEVTALSGGNIEPGGETVLVRYDYRLRNEFTAPAATNPQVEVLTFPGITTDETAGNIAARIVQKFQDIERTVDVTLPSESEDIPVVNATQFTNLPSPLDEKFYQIKSIQGTPAGISLSLGSRESLSSEVTEIESQLKSVSKNA